MKAINKAQMDSAIRKNSGPSKSLLSIPNVVISKGTNKLIDPAIGKRSTGSKLTLLMKKK